MRRAGIVLLILGIAGTLIFGVQAIQETETFRSLGVDKGVSGANWTFVIVSVIVFVIGMVLMYLPRKAFAH